MFSVSAYDFSINDEESGIMKQIGISYSPIATEDEHYTSYNGDQSNSTFKITASQENNDYLLGNLITVKQIIEGDFSVKLYKEGSNSEFVEITDGKFKITISK